MADPTLTPDEEIENAEHDESGQPVATHEHDEEDEDQDDEEEEEEEEEEEDGDDA